MENMENKSKQKKIQKMTGRLVSLRNHCAIVEVSRLVKHPKYGKFVRSQKKYKAHDTSDQRELGSLVSIIPCRPFSRDKRFMVINK